MTTPFKPAPVLTLLAAACVVCSWLPPRLSANNAVFQGVVVDGRANDLPAKTAQAVFKGQVVDQRPAVRVGLPRAPRGLGPTLPAFEALPHT